MKKTIHQLEREIRQYKDHGTTQQEVLHWLCELAEYIKDNEK